MSQEFNRDGLSFTYPDDWRLELTPEANGWTATIQSPGTAFAVVQLDSSLPQPRDVVTQALEALREDYPTLEAEPTMATLAGELAIGHDIEFFSMDMLNTCWTRSFDGLAGTIFILCQASGVDQEDYLPLLHALLGSLRSEQD